MIIDIICIVIALAWMGYFAISNRWRGAKTDKGPVEHYIAGDKKYGNLNMARMMAKDVYLMIGGEIFRLKEVTFIGRNNRYRY